MTGVHRLIISQFLVINTQADYPVLKIFFKDCPGIRVFYPGIRGFLSGDADVFVLKLKAIWQCFQAIF
jgi:hypothetical protein